MWRARCLDEGHGGFGRRPEETHRWQHRQGAPGRPHATCQVRRIPYTWVRQTRPGGIVLATVGSFTHGSALARLTVHDDGTASGSLLPGGVAFMPARAHAPDDLAGDLAARAAYPDTRRPARHDPRILDEWMPAFLTHLAAPGTQLVHVTRDGQTSIHLVDDTHESFAVLTPALDGWTAAQGGPLALWDAVEAALDTWNDAGKPGLENFHLHIDSRAHRYRVDSHPYATWTHRVT